jgi:hypothetical protein
MKEKSPKHPGKPEQARPKATPDLLGPPVPVGNGFWEPLALAAAHADGPLDRALAHIGPFYRADRVWVGRYNEELTHFWGSSDWVNDGVPSHLEEVQGVPVEFLADAHRKFLRGDSVIIPDVERLPRQSRALQAELRREGVRATFSYPLRHSGKLIGFFGFDYVRQTANWTTDDTDRIPAIEKYLAALLHRSIIATDPHSPPAAPPRSVFVTGPGSLNALAIDEVTHIQADGDYTRVHLADGRCWFERRSLRNWIGILPKERFFRVHQSYLVNVGRILRLDRGERWLLYLRDVPEPVPVGRAFRHSLRLHMVF